MPYLIYGAGSLGRKTLDRMRRAGLTPVAFLDRDTRLWGTRIDGLVVMAPEDGYQWRDHSFVVAVYNGAMIRHDLRRRGLTALSYVDLARIVGGPLYPMAYIDDPAKLQDEGDRIAAAQAVWADLRSATEYSYQVQHRLTGSDTPPPFGHYTDYFPVDLIDPLAGDDEVVIDCGAHDGDTLIDFLTACDDRFRRYYAIEPDPANFKDLQDTIRRLPAWIAERVAPINGAVTDHCGTGQLHATGTMDSHLITSTSESYENVRLVNTFTIDSQFLDGVHQPTTIKLDIEGSEIAALEGARACIARFRPVLAVCLYHRVSHLWDIPLLIRDLVPDYKLHLRRFADDGWETILYAIPPGRYVPDLPARFAECADDAGDADETGDDGRHATFCTHASATVAKATSP